MMPWSKALVMATADNEFSQGHKRQSYSVCIVDSPRMHGRSVRQARCAPSTASQLGICSHAWTRAHWEGCVARFILAAPLIDALETCVGLLAARAAQLIHVLFEADSCAARCIMLTLVVLHRELHVCLPLMTLGLKRKLNLV